MFRLEGLPGESCFSKKISVSKVTSEQTKDFWNNVLWTDGNNVLWTDETKVYVSAQRHRRAVNHSDRGVMFGHHVVTESSMNLMNVRSF